ncbi:GIY-YIG nuclease family protein [Helicobacter suis]|uniref:Excinuclease ABC subunit C n=3 Tax=Helicobacter suis TaxID=104628 RepID=A0A6J4D2G4_9HELI|nr:GIY-YIG nuclease family protein [Helicobacter suis]BCD46688.1 hypothetical protein NHP190020_17270 [Helicobacter suis]BCD71020.1 hypothetical protein SNTW_16650 [Helicobacter suis]BDR28088.1 hypothetical protein HSHS1_08490 [Helicobacter suis HS1]
MDAKVLVNLPTHSGIYLYFDTKHRLLYVGKAKNLQKRILSYFKIKDGQVLPNPKNSLRVQRMVAQIASIQTQFAANEEEALLLENQTIKAYQPKYNILLKDDKTYPYICVDLTKPYPFFALARKVKPGYTGFGPFSSGARDILESLLEFVPLVQSKSCLQGKKACIFYEMRRCKAPCEGKITQQDYALLVEQALALLTDKSKLVALIEQRMRTLALQERFEEAAIYRDHLQKIQALLKRSEQSEERLIHALQTLFKLQKLPQRIEIFDASHHAQTHCVGGMVVFSHGKWLKNAYRRYLLQGKDEYAQMREMLERRLKNLKEMPDLWLLDGGRAQVCLAEDILKAAGFDIKVLGIAKAKVRGKAKRARGDVEDVIYESNQTWHLKAQDSCLQFLQKLRDEAHRFAISYHRLRKLKALV